MFMLMSLLFYAVIHFGYSKVPEKWQKKIVGG
jgi:cbb3-type cytochrome oxidase subunit 3